MTPDGIIIFLFKEYVYVLIFLGDEAPRKMVRIFQIFQFFGLGLRKKKQKTLPKAWKICWELCFFVFFETLIGNFC